MKIYLVGGAVRDELLGFDPKEKDYVVVGATIEQMLQLGFKQVGKDFPVFLHPETKEEYALARKERKTGRGYTGFSFDTSAQVSLEEDLMRRDLTINAMAKDLDTDEIIDPYNGQEDLGNKILRHVSPAFQEDPVRILRVARFAARYASLGFRVAEETIELMKRMVEEGEVNALVPERVWKELERALGEKNPEMFFEVLKECKAFEILFPSISGEGLAALQKAAKVSSDNQVRFAALMHHPSPDQTEFKSRLSEDSVNAFADRYRIPNDYKKLAFLVVRYLKQYSQINQLKPAEILALLQALDAFRRTQRFDKFLSVCRLLGPSKEDVLLRTCLEAAKGVDINTLIMKGFSDNELAEKIREQREQAIRRVISAA